MSLSFSLWSICNTLLTVVVNSVERKVCVGVFKIMLTKIFNVKIEYFDTDFRRDSLDLVVLEKFNKKHCETTFYFISEIDENNEVVISSKTYPYATVLSQSEIIYSLLDDKFLYKNEKVSCAKHEYTNRYIKRNFSRRRGWVR